MVFNNHLNYHSCILCNKNEENYDEVINENIAIHYIVNDNEINNVLVNTDVLMLIGFYDFNLKMIEKFKSVNPKGKINLKLDLNIHWLGRIVFDKYNIDLLNECTLISVECKNLKEIINQKCPIKVEYIPNGFYNSHINRNVEFKEKENIIITVGRLGNYQKATDILLEAFKIVSKKLTNWKLKLIGGIDPSFQVYIDNYMNTNPVKQKFSVSLQGLRDFQMYLEKLRIKAAI